MLWFNVDALMVFAVIVGRIRVPVEFMDYFPGQKQYGKYEEQEKRYVFSEPEHLRHKGSVFNVFFLLY